MEERLKALDLSKIPPNLEQESTLKADSMVHLLLQGLQSKDVNMINVSICFKHGFKYFVSSFKCY